MLFFWTFYSSKNPEENVSRFPGAQLFFQKITRNVSWAANQNITMISEGSYDTEDSSNHAENSALITAINYNLKSTQI